MKRNGKLQPAVFACFVEDFEACRAHLRCPPASRKNIRPTKLPYWIDRSARSDVSVDSAGHLVGGQQVLKIMYEAMIYLIGKAEYLGKIGSK